MTEDLDALLTEQVAYYRARAGEYDATYPLDGESETRRRLRSALEALAPLGRVLELACGTGQWTVELARLASSVTAVDASPEALEVCRRRIRADAVSLVEADLFRWRPEERYDLVFFSAWLSHVPPQRFDAFWELIADCLAPGGRVFVIDELPAVAELESEAPGEPAPTVHRRLTTGDRFRAVKVLYDPHELRGRLAALGWDAEVHAVDRRFFSAIVRISERGSE